jgi:hypothetical protein
MRAITEELDAAIGYERMAHERTRLRQTIATSVCRNLLIGEWNDSTHQNRRRESRSLDISIPCPSRARTITGMDAVRRATARALEQQHPILGVAENSG